MKYKFYGNDTPSLLPIKEEFNKVKDQRHLYDLLSDIWCEETCAPRMRKNWSKENKTLGQCSITAFLVQDIFGGFVYGVPLEDGNFHCFNVVNHLKFDLTSEQFNDEILDYDNVTLQAREEHFLKHEKYLRYLYLKDKLIEKLKSL